MNRQNNKTERKKTISDTLFTLHAGSVPGHNHKRRKYGQMETGRVAQTTWKRDQEQRALAGAVGADGKTSCKLRVF